MKKKISIEVESDEIVFGYWNEAEQEFIELQNDEDCAAAAKVLKASPILLDGLVMFADKVKENVTADLRDLWKRLDDLEARLNAKA